jgi:hypothetical protein
MRIYDKPLLRRRSTWTGLGALICLAAAEYPQLQQVLEPLLPVREQSILRAAGGILAYLAVLYARQGASDLRRHLADEAEDQHPV